MYLSGSQFKDIDGKITSDYVLHKQLQFVPTWKGFVAY